MNIPCPLLRSLAGALAAPAATPGPDVHDMAAPTAVPQPVADWLKALAPTLDEPGGSAALSGRLEQCLPAEFD